MAPSDPSSIVRIVFHPATGNGKALARAQNVAQALTEQDIPYELVDASLSQSAEQHSAQHSDRAVIIVGGDGLIHRMIPQILYAKVPIGIIPAGSGNDLWRMTGLGNHEESIRRVISYCTIGGQTTAIDVLELDFEQEAQPQKRYALGAVSWGAEAKINAAANALPRQLGSFRYILGLLLTVPKLKGFHTVVQGETNRFAGSALAASIANIRSLGGGIKLFPNADFSDGAVELSIVRGSTVWPALPLVPKILFGEDHSQKVGWELTEAQIQCHEDCYADGEYVGTGNFDVKVIPGALKLIC